jgi:prepilin-type N-terminal cleavage/methylation domain-containing protein
MKKYSGFNLVELLIALIVVSIALFGIAKLQVNGMHSMESAKMTTSSVVNVANLVERFSKIRDEIKVYLDANDKFVAQKSSRSRLVTDDSLCENKPVCATGSGDSIGNRTGICPESADITLKCEIDAWMASTFETLNLQNDDDICYSVRVAYDDNFEYSPGIKYAIPKVTIALKWKKISGVDWGNGGCSANADTGLMTVPAVDSDIGYMSMEYIAP